jgi:predicted amidohydrolase
MSKLKVTTIQADLIWEDVDANIAMFDQLIEGIGESTDVIILPEMFATGFSMNSKELAEPIDGKTMYWMHETAKKYDCVVTGSMIFNNDENYFNRLIWMHPDGTFDYYDKHQLFKMGGEHRHYSAGHRKVIIKYKGWRICPLICYDLRFPVWARNVEDYDLLIYVANWPISRNFHWRVLLQARAIENQVYTIGVNRVGKASGLDYSGNTSIFDPFGIEIYHVENEVAVATHTIDLEHVRAIREKIPYLQDRDKFEIIINE